MRRLARYLLVVALLLGALLAAGCGRAEGGAVRLRVAASTELMPLEPFLAAHARAAGWEVDLTYIDSVDLMLAMADEGFPYDAVWPAHSLWLDLGARQGTPVRYAQSIARSPLVVGVRLARARELGLEERDVAQEEVLALAAEGALRLVVPNPTRAHAGAMLYLAALQTPVRGRAPLAEEDVPGLDPEASLPGGLRPAWDADGAGAAADAKALYLEERAVYDGLVADEAVLIATNQELLRQGAEPLYAIYPVGGGSVADYPLAYVDRGDARRERAFLGLQEALLSEEGRAELARLGWRSAPVGTSAAGADPVVFNTDWGIQRERTLGQQPLPAPDALLGALRAYRAAFRRPAFTVYALDYSASMAGGPERAMEAAMATLLDGERAGRHLLDIGPEDVTVVIPFRRGAEAVWVTQGNRPEFLAQTLERIERTEPGGVSDLNLPLIEALNVLRERAVSPQAYRARIVLMTDGRSAAGDDTRALRQAYEALGREVPVVVLLVGDGERALAEEVAALTGGAVFDGAGSLIEALRTATAYNREP